MMQAPPELSAKADDAPPDRLGDRSRGDILAAAAHCFMERGYTETSIDDVARRLGATKGRVYHHFGSKAELFAQIFQAGMDKDFAAIEPYRGIDAPAVVRLRDMARAHCREIIRSRPHQRVVWQGVTMLMRGATTPELRDELTRLSVYRDDYEQIFRDTLEQARVEGAVSFGSLSLAVSLMFVTLNSPIFWYSPRAGETDKDTDALVEQIVTFAMRGLGARED